MELEEAIAAIGRRYHESLRSEEWQHLCCNLGDAFCKETGDLRPQEEHPEDIEVDEFYRVVAETGNALCDATGASTPLLRKRLADRLDEGYRLLAKRTGAISLKPITDYIRGMKSE